MSAFELYVGAIVLFEGRRHLVEEVTFQGWVPPYGSLVCLGHAPCEGCRRPVTWWALDWPEERAAHGRDVLADVLAPVGEAERPVVVRGRQVAARVVGERAAPGIGQPAEFLPVVDRLLDDGEMQPPLGRADAAPRTGTREGCVRRVGADVRERVLPLAPAPERLRRHAADRE